MIKRILVGVSGTPGMEAKVNLTIDLAWRHKAEIELVDVVDVERLSDVGPVPIGAGHFASRIAKHRIEHSHEVSDKAVSIFKQRCDGAQIPVSIVSQEGNPIVLLADLWRYVDVCILDARGWFDHDVMPDPEHALGQLVASGVRPIIAVPEETTEGVNRVAITYNGALESAKAMKHFAQLGLYPEAQIELLLAGDPKSKEPASELLGDAQRYLEAHGYSVTTKHLTEDRARVDLMLEHCEHSGVDMIVMGGSFHRVLLSRRFGGTTIGMLKRSKIPLFISH